MHVDQLVHRQDCKAQSERAPQFPRKRSPVSCGERQGYEHRRRKATACHEHERCETVRARNIDARKNEWEAEHARPHVNGPLGDDSDELDMGSGEGDNEIEDRKQKGEPSKCRAELPVFTEGAREKRTHAEPSGDTCRHQRKHSCGVGEEHDRRQRHQTAAGRIEIVSSDHVAPHGCERDRSRCTKERRNPTQRCDRTSRQRAVQPPTNPAIHDTDLQREDPLSATLCAGTSLCTSRRASCVCSSDRPCAPG